MKTAILIAIIVACLYFQLAYFKSRHVQKFRKQLRAGQTVRFRYNESKEIGQIISLNHSSAMIEGLNGILYFKTLNDIYPI